MLNDRCIPHQIGKCWYVLDTADGHTTVCRNRSHAEERAKLHSFVLRRAEQKRAHEEAIFQRLLAERKQAVFQQLLAEFGAELPVLRAVTTSEQLTTA